MTDISIVLPVHNQADHIAKLIGEYVGALEKIPGSHELVLVTNACRDESPRVCQSLSEKYPIVKTVDTKLGGWGRSLKLGLNVATGKTLCYTNSARTSPEVLTLILLYSIAFPDLVIKTNRKIRDSLTRRVGSLFYNLECRALFDLPTWDINGTPKVFPRKFEKLLHLQSDDDLIDAEFNVVCSREKYPVIEVPILDTKRHSGKSTTNYSSAVKMYWGAYELWRNFREPSRV